MAQTANGGGAQNAKVQAAYADWRKLSQSEVNCVDQSLRGQRTSLWSLIQRGIDPTDAAVARLRAGCRAQANAPNTSVLAQSGPQAQAAAVESALDRAVAEKATADRAVADKAAADKAAADKATADKAAADKAAADKAAADKAAADKAAAAKVATDKSAAAKTAADKAAAEKAAAEQAAIDLAKAETERAKAEAIKAQSIADQPRPEADKTAADVTWAAAAAEARTSFVYGLISSPICLGLGGMVFLWVARRRRMTGTPSEALAPGRAGGGNHNEFDRLVTAVLAELRRREAKKSEPRVPEREQRIDEPVLH